MHNRVDDELRELFDRIGKVRVECALTPPDDALERLRQYLADLIQCVPASVVTAASRFGAPFDIIGVSIDVRLFVSPPGVLGIVDNRTYRDATPEDVVLACIKSLNPLGNAWLIQVLLDAQLRAIASALIATSLDETKNRRDEERDVDEAVEAFYQTP